GLIERLSSLPELERAHRVHDLRTGARFLAAHQNAVRSTGVRIEGRRIGERRLVGLVEVVLVLEVDAAGRPKAHVEWDATGSDVREGAFKDDPAILVGVETEVDQGANVAPRLRRSHDQRVMNPGSVSLDRQWV